MAIRGKVSDKRSKWLVLEDEGFLHIMPATDILPHGKRINDKLYELTADCPCNPEVKAGDERGIFEMPIVTHNSFEDEARIQEVMKKNGL